MRWVLRLFTADNKRSRKSTSRQCLTLFRHKTKEFLLNFVAVDETWIHWYTKDQGTVETLELTRRWQWSFRPEKGDQDVISTNFGFFLLKTWHHLAKKSALPPWEHIDSHNWRHHDLTHSTDSPDLAPFDLFWWKVKSYFDYKI